MGPRAAERLAGTTRARSAGLRALCCSALLQSPPQNTTIAEFYARGGSCVTGCQTKMVLGVPCAATLALTPALLCVFAEELDDDTSVQAAPIPNE